MYETLSNRGVIKIIGIDSARFLQNLVTNNINKSNYCYTYLLNNQGRYLFDFFVYVHNPEEIYIDINENNKSALINHFNFYKFRSKIEVIDCKDDYKVVYSHQELKTNSLVSARDPRYHQLGFRSILSDKQPDESKKELYLEDKYNFAIIDGIEDLKFDESIPVFYGAEELNAVSYDKGCYVGQEVISRAKYQGVIRRKIYKVTSEEDLSLLVKDEEVLADNDKIGVICSSYKNKAIALIREEKYLANEKAKITVRGIKVALSPAPWYSLAA